jgi:signal transduction histidine kinase
MLEVCENNIPEELYTNSKYIKKVNLTLIGVHKRYNNKLNEEMQKNIEFRRIISQFIHAMKTPVTVIELATQKCKDSLCNEDMAYNINDTVMDISKENIRQLEMLNNLLEYLRLEEFSKDYTPVAVDLSNELKQIINNRKRSFIYGNVRPSITSTEQGKVEIFTDLKWNRIMLDQIISNAIKYSPATDKMKKIDFSIERIEDKTILTISDEGIGIPQQDIHKVMDAFFTGDNGRKMENATGIGLYIVKLISENLGHEILIESQVGVGTTVRIIYHKIQNYRLI